MKKEFNIGTLVENLKSVQPYVDFNALMVREIKEAIPGDAEIPDALRMFFKLYIKKSMIKAKEEDREIPYDRQNAISTASKVFEVEEEVAAEFFDQVEEEAKKDAAEAIGNVSWPSRGSDEEDTEPTDTDIEKSHRLVRTGEAKDGFTKLMDIGQPSLDGIEKPDEAAEELGDDQSLEPVDFKKKAPKSEQDTMKKVQDKELEIPTQQIYDGLFEHMDKKNLNSMLKEGKINELNQPQFYTTDVISNMDDKQLNSLVDVTSKNDAEDWKKVTSLIDTELQSREGCSVVEEMMNESIGLWTLLKALENENNPNISREELKKFKNQVDLLIRDTENQITSLKKNPRGVDEAKMGVDYVKSVKSTIKQAVAALKSKDYDAAAEALEDVADDAGDGARAARKMKRAADAKEEKDKVTEAKMGVDYVKSAKAAVKTAVAALKDKDYDAAAEALENVADDASDAAKAAKKMKREVDKKESLEKEKAEVTEAEDVNKVIKKSDTDADVWNSKAKKKTRESIYICNACARTFKANESKCTHCLSEDVENITGTGDVISKGLMTEDEVQKLLSDEITIEEEVVEEVIGIEQQLKMGIEVEKEHTDDANEAAKIAIDHLQEDAEYYTKLKKMEAGKCDEGNEEVEIDVNDEEDDDICTACGHGHMRCTKVTSEHECDNCGVTDKREQLAKPKKATNESEENGAAFSGMSDEDLEKLRKEVAAADKKGVAMDGVAEEVEAEMSSRGEKVVEEFGKEEDKFRTVGRGFEDRRDAENTARDKKGTVVVDDTDDKKFMVIVKSE
jgi:gas vesicle protein